MYLIKSIGPTCTVHYKHTMVGSVHLNTHGQVTQFTLDEHHLGVLTSLWDALKQSYTGHISVPDSILNQYKQLQYLYRMDNR